MNEKGINYALPQSSLATNHNDGVRCRYGEVLNSCKTTNKDRKPESTTNPSDALEILPNNLNDSKSQ